MNILLIILIGSTVTQLFYYLFFYLRIGIYKNKKQEAKQEPVSVIICARNESENLEKFLPSILEQNYTEYQVIVVNDASTDNSDKVLLKLKNKYPNLAVTTIYKDEKFSHGKKLALTIGIKKAKYEQLILTDADCVASDKNWISSMQKNFNDDKEIIIAYGAYTRKKGLLNKLIRYDAMFIAMQYLSFAIAGVPYMGVGRNIAYRKTFFFKNKGFASHMYLLSGDDDLFVNEYGNKKNIAIELNKSSFTYSEPKTSFTAWFVQKKRHFTTGKYYKKKHKLILAGEIISRILFYLTFIILIFNKIYLIYVIPIFALRFLIQFFIINSTRKRLNEKDLHIIWFIFDILIPIISFSVLISNIFKRKNTKWK